jgi:hypothetical protein
LTIEVAENFINIFATTMDEDSEKNLLSHFNARECEQLLDLLQICG